MKLSIIIISYNTREILRDCLVSIYANAPKFDFEVIVVDNDSHDESVEMLERDFPHVRLIKNETNRLFAIANNQGAAIAQGEYLLLLNSDTIVLDGSLQAMVDYFDSLPEDVVCVGPKVLNKDGSIQSTGYANPGLRERFAMCFKLHRILPPPLSKSA